MLATHGETRYSGPEILISDSLKEPNMTGRISRATTALRSSSRVFRDHPSLALLPLLSLLTVGTAYAGVGYLLFEYGLAGDVLTNDLVRYSVLFAALSISSLFGIFFNTAVVYCAAQYFRGETPSLEEGLAQAWAVRWTVAKWGLVNATAGTVLLVAEDNVPGIGSLTQSLLSMAWGLLTFFIIPVIILDETDSLRSGLQQSGRVFRQTWGESVSGTVGIGLALLPAGIAGVAALGYAYALAGGVTAYVLGFAGALVLVSCVVVGQVLGMVLRTALYQYATEDIDLDLVAELGHDNVFVDN